MIENTESWSSSPAWARAVAEGALLPGEAPLTWFEPDLDRQLQYGVGLVLLTDRRILSFEFAAGAKVNGNVPTSPIKQETWPLGEELTLTARDHAGVGRLELRDVGRRLAYWRYTINRAPGAQRILERLESLKKGIAPRAAVPVKIELTECAVCAAQYPAETQACPECGATVTKPPMRSLARLFSLASNHKGMTMFGFVLTLSSTAAGLIPPYVTMPLLDKVLIPFQAGQAADFGLVKWYLLALFAASTVSFLLAWAQTYVLAWVSERISADLRNMTYAHLHKLSLEYFGGKRTGDLISRVSNDTDRICYFLSAYVLDFITDVLMLLMTAGILLSIDPWLATITLLPIPVIGYMVHKVQSRLRRGFSHGSRAWAEMTSILADTIPGIRVVKAFAQGKREVERFKKSNDRVLAANDRVNKLWSFFTPVVILLTDMGVMVVWMFGVYRVSHRSITVGVLTAFVAYISRFYSRLDSMSRMVSATQRAAASSQRVFGILDRVPKVPEPKQPIQPERLEGRIEIRDVGFRYGARPILSGVNLTIEPGQMVGLVGPSGAGKTTIINLLCRFYDVTEGEILVDGVDIRRFPIAAYRRNIGLVLQEPFLFYGTIAENIAYGRHDASRDEIIAAARAARAHEFILRLPNGYDSLVGERGQFLSGGERQRVSIARALLIDPRILILDEATSSVDTETEREIQLALQNLIKGRTTIAIAHRLSTLQRADQLVVVERGQITAVGPHAELLERSGTYARLYQAQIDMNKGGVAVAEADEDDAE
jgi:ATP-binding cassette subfamily B protein